MPPIFLCHKLTKPNICSIIVLSLLVGAEWEASLLEQYETESYKAEITMLITNCNDLRWLKLIYAYVKRLTQ